MTYQYSKPRKTQTIFISRRRLTPDQPREELGPIHGVMPDSIEEYRVAKSLDKLKIKYYFQVPIQGGSKLRGGVVLDFLAFNPWPIPIPVHGSYWHKGDERFEEAVIADYLGVSIDYVAEHTIWDYEIPTQEDCDRVVRERVR